MIPSKMIAMTSRAGYRWAIVLMVIACPMVNCTGAGQGGPTPEATGGTPVPTLPAASPEILPSAAATARTEIPNPITSSATVKTTQTALAPGISGYTFPAEIDPQARYLFYLHGKIIEDQGLPAISPVYGEYQYAEILGALESHGLVVISEQRGKDADGVAFGRRVARQIRRLLKAGVRAGAITVVGASKGAAITVFVSYLMMDSGINYVLLGTCHPDQVEEWKQQEVTLFGNVLAISDSVDEYSGSCDKLFTRSEGRGLGQHAEIILGIGTGHGVLYQPLDEWVLPTVRWAKQEW